MTHVDTQSDFYPERFLRLRDQLLEREREGIMLVCFFCFVILVIIILFCSIFIFILSFLKGLGE